MLIITKDFPFIDEKDDIYILSSIVYAGNVTIQLDKRVHIVEDIYVAGDIISNVDIVVGGAIVVYGQAFTMGIQAKTVKMIGRSHIRGDFMSKESCILATTEVDGNFISIGNMKTISELRIGKDAAFSGESELCFPAFVNGKVSANGVCIIKDVIFCEELKYNGEVTKTYTRSVSDIGNFILLDNSISIMVPDEGWVNFDSIDDAKKSINKEGVSGIYKDAVKLLIDNYDNLKNIKLTIIKEPTFN